MPFPLARQAAAGESAARNRPSGSGTVQQETIALLSRAETFGLPPDAAVERIDTHISTIFLAGDRAYKLKKAVVFSFVDFSDPETRRRACEREVELGRRTAPFLYIRVVPVVRETDGTLALDGDGTPVEWLVEMSRFDEDLLLDRLAARERLEVPVVEQLGRIVACFHEQAPRCAASGGADAMGSVVNGNLRDMLSAPADVLDPASCADLHAASLAFIERHRALLDARQQLGLVRQCHGDLHLHNVFLWDGRPVPFDAIEFNDELARIDVMYDFAFLVMDLTSRHLLQHANAALNAYLRRRADYAGLRLLPLFLSCRAAIRAKVSAAEAPVQDASSEAVHLRRDAAAYLERAREFLRPPPAALIAIGGYSGSGKTTLAARLAPVRGAAPGAVIVRTDVIRKQLLGVNALTRLPDDAYDAETTARVYARALHAAEAIITAGHSAIVDAVFARPAHRAAVARVAAAAGVPFTGIWLEVPPEVAAERLQTRTADASDATPRVLWAQMRQGAGPIDWMRVDGRSFLDRSRCAFG